MERLSVARWSDAGVPRVAAFGRGRAEAFAEFFKIVGDGEAGDDISRSCSRVGGERAGGAVRHCHGRSAPFMP